MLSWIQNESCLMKEKITILHFDYCYFMTGIQYCRSQYEIMPRKSIPSGVFFKTCYLPNKKKTINKDSPATPGLHLLPRKYIF